MSNKLEIRLKEERAVGFDFKPIGEPMVSVYACCDGISGWIGNASNEEGLMQVAGPENLIRNMEENLSCDEIECIMPALECNNNIYYIDNKEYVAAE